MASRTPGVSRADEAKNTPAAQLGRHPDPATKRLIVCAGDSITRGDVSSDWVQMLRGKRSAAGDRFVNAGVNGNLAWNVAQRLDPIIECAPDVVTLLIGTNDVQATFSPRMQAMMKKQQGLPRDADLNWYLENVGAILDRLSSETSSKIVIIDIPMLGEDLTSDINRTVRAYNSALRELAEGRSVPVLPLHDRLAALLPGAHNPPPYNARTSAIITSALQHAIAKRSWDDISRRRGMVALTDLIHLNDRSAMIVADLVSGFLGDDLSADD